MSRPPILGKDVSLTLGIRHIEILVEDLDHAVASYRSFLSSSVEARRFENSNRSSAALGSGGTVVMLGVPLGSDSPMAENLRVHGEGT
jgi:hypothetical protein